PPRGDRPDAPAVARARGAERGRRLDGSPARPLGPPVRCRRRVPEGGRFPMNTPPKVPAQEWEAAREQLLVKEKELTRARDALAAQRRRMPWTEVDKQYRFEGPDGPVSLPGLFEGRRQLIVYRFFYEPGVSGWPDSGCPGCSFVGDQVANLAHLNARDTT